METRERELRSLHTNPVDVECALVRLAIWSIEHDASSGFDEVAFQNLRYERERTRSTEVTFDYLDFVVLSQILDIEWTGDVQFLRNLTADALDTTSGFEVNLLSREYQCSVTRVNTGKLDVFRDSVFYHFTILRNGVEFDFLGVEHELRYHYREFLRYFLRHLQEFLQFVFVVANVHRCTREYVRRTNQYRITYLSHEFFHVFDAGQFLPSRLVDAELVEHSRELVTVFCTVDRDRRCTEDRH